MEYRNRKVDFERNGLYKRAPETGYTTNKMFQRNDSFPHDTETPSVTSLAG